MNHVIKFGDCGIAFHAIETNNYQNWLATQAEFVKAWLKNSQYTQQGLALVPNANGELACAVFVADDFSDYFLLGDVASQLPAGDYLLNAAPEHLSAIAFGFGIGGYRFNRYTNNSEKFASLVINNQTVVSQTQKQIEAVALVRDLVNTPASDMMPENLSAATKQLAEEFSADFDEIIGDELLTENYPSIHTVGRASVHAPRLLDLTWGDENAPKVTLVGKGVCFDSGGLDIKPANGMRLMKKDMGGSAHVLGLARLIMANQLPVRLRVLIPAVENAVAGNAMRPGDVIKTRKGLTVEVDNTDAEGRLVLCDALAEAVTEQPELLIDFATLTGAMRVALGTELPGFFASNEQTATALKQAGDSVCDPVWQMPLFQNYNSLLNSEIADLANCATAPFGGAITAALYLQRFIDEHPNWLHFDVMAWNNRKQSGRPIGGEAFGIRAVYQYLAQRYQA